MAISAHETRGQRSEQTGLPSAPGDFYDIASLLNEDDSQIVGRVRAFMEEAVAPVINQYWARAEFPFELIPQIASLGIAGLSYTGYGWPARSPMLDGFIAMELARVDSSIATFGEYFWRFGSLYQLCASVVRPASSKARAASTAKNIRSSLGCNSSKAGRFTRTDVA